MRDPLDTISGPDLNYLTLVAIITLTTDFGQGSPYVAAMKGVILSINPAAVLVDITHAIAAQDVGRGALVLEDTTPWFPADTIHLAVVDPGVGSQRAILYARIGPQQYVAPDNGLLGRLMARTAPSAVIRLAEPEHWLPEVSWTFQGRDIMAPVAARLSLGLDPRRLGPPAGPTARLDWPQPRVADRKIRGQVIHIDSFGNLITNISADLLAGRPTDTRVCVVCGIYETFGILRTYAEQGQGTLAALVGSTGHLELAIVGDNAAARLGVSVGCARGRGLGVRMDLDQLRDWDRTLVWHAFTQMAEYEPLIIDRGRGCLLFDVEGREYIDGTSSLWCNLHGHAHPRIDAAIRRQLDARGARHVAGGVQPGGDPPGPAAGGPRPAGPGARVLLRRRGHGRRGGPQNGLPILAAAAPPPARENLLPGPGRRLPRRHPGRGQRGGGRAVPRPVPAAAVRDLAGAGPRYVPHPARRARRAIG